MVSMDKSDLVEVFAENLAWSLFFFKEPNQLDSNRDYVPVLDLRATIPAIRFKNRDLRIPVDGP